jgi:hypothetical protein
VLLKKCSPPAFQTKPVLWTHSTQEAPVTTTSLYAFIYIKLLKLKKFNFRHQVNKPVLQNMTYTDLVSSELICFENGVSVKNLH